MSRSRRPSISVHDYPEHLNPFNESDDNFELITGSKESAISVKESKHKFWTFGRGRKKKSGSFSIKSTWNDLFGKRKSSTESSERRATVSTGASSCKTEQNGKAVASRDYNRDQMEFDEALGTLARRRKYTYDNASRCSTTATVNEHSTRIYSENPQDTTASIMGNETPKPPVRRFGQVSPRPTDKIPPLLYEEKEREHNESGAAQEREPDQTPIPPKRNGIRSSQRSIRTSQRFLDRRKPEVASSDVTIRDENENVPDDFVFKRFNQDSVRMSNLSINSCISVSSTTSAYTRKKRRAPQPPRRAELLEAPKENVICQQSETTKEEKKVDEFIETNESEPKTTSEFNELSTNNSNNTEDAKLISNVEENNSKIAEQKNIEESHINSTTADNKIVEKEVVIELRREPECCVEVIKDAELYSSLNEARSSQKISETLSRSNSFSVKDEIEKIEKQIQELEAKTSTEVEESNENFSRGNVLRKSIEENRRSFFKNMVTEKEADIGVDVKVTQLPCARKDYDIVRLTDSPVPADGSKEPVKVIELHISEPIKQKPELLPKSPVPRPRRSSSLTLERQRSMDSQILETKGSKLSL